MPNRILKDSICTSPTIDELTEQEENFFYRLMVHCDDYGLMDARESVIRAKLYPLRLNRISDAIIRNLLMRCAAAGLIEVYEVKGRPYLHLTTWENHQQIRAKRPKYPKPSEGQPITLIKEALQSSDINGNHLMTLAPVIQSNPIQSESNPIQSESEISADISAQAPIFTYGDFARALVDKPANAQAVILAGAFETVYGSKVTEYGRLGALAKKPGAGETLKMIFSCVGTWNGIDNPLDYVTKALNSKNGKNGHSNGHLPEKLPTNHQPADLPDVIDWESLDADEIRHQEDEKDRIAFEKRLAAVK